MRNRIAVVCGVALLSFACGAEKPRSNAKVERHPIHGVIQSLDAQSKSATIKHNDIPGFMEAMTMEFPVRGDAEFKRLRTGETIDGTVFTQEADFWVGEIREAK